MEIRSILTLLESVGPEIPQTPVTGQRIGTVVNLISGDDFDQRSIPFVATLDGWRELNAMESDRGRADAVLKTDGETVPDEQMGADPRRKALAAKPSWPTISHLYQLEALPVGAVILKPTSGLYDDDPRAEEYAMMVKQPDGWTNWSQDPGSREMKQSIAPVAHMDGFLGQYKLVSI